MRHRAQVPYPLRVAILAALGAHCPPLWAQPAPAQPPAEGTKEEKIQLEETPAAPKPAEPAPAAPANTEPAASTSPAPANTPAAAPVPAASSPEEAKAKAEPAPSRRFLGMGVGTPDTGALPGRFKPSFGAPPRAVSDYRFDFHGYLNVPLRAGANKREDPTEYQYETVLHGKPLVPDDFERFEHTGNVPEPWVQLAFSYGNSRAVATVIIAARTVSNASGYFNPPTQLGINDAWVTFTPGFGNLDLQFDVGGFSERYGGMGEYDLGRYDTPVIARVGGVGETARLRYPISEKLMFLAEHGVMGQLDKAPLGVEPAGWNDFADPNVGTTFAHHAHLGLNLADTGRLGLHYVGAFARDDRTSPSTRDGSITVLGADASAQFAPFGRLFLGVGHTSADDARSVSPVVRVLNTSGGLGLMEEYLGPASNGNGSLLTLATQYDVSIGEIVRSPDPYSGYAPDVFVTLFGMYTSVSSDDEAYDGVGKLKYGGELTYSMLSWLALSTRYDRVVANLDEDNQTYAVVSPKLILRSDYNSQDQVTLQYSRWFYGSGVNVRTGYPPREDASIVPDENTFSLTASMWW
jgi:hypothetical protein